MDEFEQRRSDEDYAEQVRDLVGMLRRYRTELGWVADHKALHADADTLLKQYSYVITPTENRNG